MLSFYTLTIPENKTPTNADSKPSSPDHNLI